MLQKLFSSRVRVEILSVFLMNPERELYVREVERLTGEDYKNVSMEFAILRRSAFYRVEMKAISSTSVSIRNS